jgi:hypothetical protein
VPFSQAACFEAAINSFCLMTVLHADCTVCMLMQSINWVMTHCQLPAGYSLLVAEHDNITLLHGK